MSSSSSKPKLDPRNFPRPPKLEQVPRRLEVKWGGEVIADAQGDGFWVLETFHPPTYYIPRSALKVDVAPSNARQTYCEWKGRATYWDLVHPKTGETVRSRIWSYEQPNPSFAPIKGYLCFYAEPWDCFVDGEKVVPQPGDFYGGWVTDEILGDWVKGAPGTTHCLREGTNGLLITLQRSDSGNGHATSGHKTNQRMLRIPCLRYLHRPCGEATLRPRLAGQLFRSRGLVTLAIESSCDDTSVAVLEKDDAGKATLHFHEKVTADNKQDLGINPKTTAISHSRALAPLVQRGLAHLPPVRGDGSQTQSRAANSTKGKALDFVSVTRGPGLFSPLSIGLSLAKGLAVAFNVPLVGVNHMQAHALTPRLVSALKRGDGSSSSSSTTGSSQAATSSPPIEPSPEFPFMSLLVSGGHTMVLSSRSLNEHTILGSTMDVAAGDALDKMARLILPADVLRAAPDVSYARVLETFVFGDGPLAQEDAYAYDYEPPRTRTDELVPRQSAYGWSLPVPLTKDGARLRDPNMSFVGLNSAVERICKARGQEMSVDERRQLGHEAMRVTFEHIASRIVMQLEATIGSSSAAPAPAAASSSTSTTSDAAGSPHPDLPITALVASGGVAANRFLRHLLRRILDAKGFQRLPLDFPPLEFCTDNAAMIAWAGVEMYEAGWRSSLECAPHSRWSMDPSASDGGILGVGGWERWK